MINTDQIVSVEQRLLFMDYDYKVIMSDGRQFIVEDEAKEQLRTLIHGDKRHEPHNGSMSGSKTPPAPPRGSHFPIG